MSFQPIRRLLPQAIRSAGIERQVTSARVLAEAQSALVRLWGEEKAAYVTPVSFSDAALKLSTRAPAAAQELKAWEARLLNEMNRVLGERVVRTLRIVTA